MPQKTATDDNSRQRSWGTFLSFVGIAVSFCGGMVVTPAILESIGDREYGFFTLASSLIALIMLLDLGASDGSIRFLIAAKQGKVAHPQTWVLDQINQFYFLLAILVAVISVVLSLTYPYSLNGIRADEYSRITVILSIAFTGLVVSISCNGYNSVLIAEQRFFFLKTLDLVTQSLMIVLLLIAAFTNCGTITLIAITSILAATPAVLKRAYTHRFLNYRRERPAIDVGFIRSILFYSMPILVVSAGEVIYWKLDFLIIG
ncbi:oligosaccharide flippase family protein [Mariniblastus sp.]|nr:oligosaccharide flippase family protein [Mariniblastus sp.]